MAAAKKKKRSLFCAALVAGTINKLEQSIFAPSISMVVSQNVAKVSKVGRSQTPNIFAENFANVKTASLLKRLSSSVVTKTNYKNKNKLNAKNFRTTSRAINCLLLHLGPVSKTFLVIHNVVQ
jgi:hypothetical protein